MDNIHLIATAAFGLEAPVKREVKNLGFTDITALDGRVDFYGGISSIPKANIWLRSADRVLLVIGEFEAITFDGLFEKTKALAWENWVTEDAKFTVTGKSVKSKLFSVPDCQAIVKKAVVEKLKSKYNREWFPETGAEYKIQVSLLRDKATLTIDTTGAGLHKRGYRPAIAAAPIKETLAAALVSLSYFRKDRVLYDPFCGSGTIPIEAALIAKNIAPGLRRRFVSEQWPQISPLVWKNARDEAKSLTRDIKPELYGSDIDEKCVELARFNARRAGVSEYINFEVKDIYNSGLPAEYGLAIMNPPYGERLDTIEEARNLYRRIGQIFKDNKKWPSYIITSDEEFERFFGKRANAKRKLFNGMIKTDYYQYHGEKPEK